MKRVVIDAGHGGNDPGASYNGVLEKDLTLKISEYMYDLFKEKGIDVTLIRNSDETISPKERVNRVLNAYGNDPNVIVISNHINSSSDGSASGSEVIYALRNNGELANNILNALANAGMSPRKAYQRRLPSNPSKDYYFMLRNTGNTESLIIEYGFINNRNDLNKLQNNYKDLVKAVVDAVTSYINGKSINQNNPNAYTIKQGDSLYKIAKAYNISINDLKKENNLSSNNLSVGQVLIIPKKKINNSENTNSNSKNTYIVKRGDTLYSIARNNNMSVQELKELNNLNTNLLSIGQKLKLKRNNTYQVKAGDTLWSIARNNNMTVDDLKKINNLNNNLLSIGQILQLS